MLKFYHYMALSNYHSMQHSHSVFKREYDDAHRRSLADSFLERSNLRASSAMIAPIDRYPGAPSITRQAAVFGLLELEPESWWRELHPTGHPILEVIFDMHSIGGGPLYIDQIALIEAQMPQDAPVYVADWGVHIDPDEKFDGPYGRHSPSTKRAYVNSLVPLKDYTADMNYRLPEVICFQDVPFENTRIVQRDMASFLCDRMREKYGHEPRHYSPDMEEVEYSCPIVFD